MDYQVLHLHLHRRSGRCRWRSLFWFLAASYLAKAAGGRDGHQADNDDAHQDHGVVHSTNLFVDCSSVGLETLKDTVNCE